MTAEFHPIATLTGPGEAAANLDALARLFPGVVTEQGLDVDTLREMLGEGVPPAGTEVFGLRWPGMGEARRLSTEPATGTLLPRPDESVDWDTTGNIVIEGDNLEVLRLLRRGYTGEVDVIYIDPPYNTGNDFVYDDSRMSSLSEYEIGAGQRDETGPLQAGAGSERAQDRRTGASKHTKWLSMMYPRLLVAHNLLKESGVIIVAIDDVEHARLRLLLDKVFGAENFAANVVWQGGSKNDSRFTSGGLDYMLIYAKNLSMLVDDDVRWTEPKQGHGAVLEMAKRAWAESGGDSAEAARRYRAGLRAMKAELEPAVFRYDQIDDSGRVFQAGDLVSPNPRPNLAYDLAHPLTGKPVPMHENGWRLSRERMIQSIAEGRILFGPDHTTMPRYKRYLDEMPVQAIRPYVVQERASASYALRKLIGSDAFDHPKDASVVAKWIDALSQGRRDTLVLDFFAGSGSTGHAVMGLNAADGGNRRYILVQLDEQVDKDGYATIADITRERLRRAGAHIAAKPTLDAPDIDTGFRSYRLATSNVKAWDGAAQLSLMDSVDNLIAGRTTDDLLVEMMLRLGVDLVAPVDGREVAGSTLYSVSGTIYAYFGTGVTTGQADEVARALVAWRDEKPVDSDITFVARDTGFRNSAAKLNFAAALEQAGFSALRSI